MIRFEHVTKRYGGQVTAVDDLSLDVPAGDLLVLLGESGCGKTTTLKMINRLIEPTAGRIEVDGKNHRDVPAVELRRGIGYVFQGVGLFPHMTVGENVAIVPRLLGWPRDKTAARVDELMDMMGLPPDEYRDRPPRQLSGGQRQRVGVARALAASPRIMLMDEPFGALDPLTRDVLQNEYVRLHHKLGLTTVMVTHDMTEALLMADHIAVMREGKVLRHATPHELMTEPGHEYVERLMSTPKQQADRLEELIAEAEG